MDVIQSKQAKIGYIEPYAPKDAPRRWIRTDKVPYFGTESEPIGVVAISFDVTPEMELREQLVASNEELEKFAYVASHDLQEPLRKIQTYCEFLETKCSDGLNDEGQKYISRMGSASQRMQTLILDLLDYSRVSPNKSSCTEFDFAELIELILSDLEISIQETNGFIEVNNIPTFLLGNKTQIKQLFQNLIGNALKFHKPNVSPIIKIYGKSTSNNDYVEICVEDNGIGIEKEYGDKIFEVFQRLHGRSLYDGTGIGLAICRKIVEQHQGTLTLESNVGRGSIFTVKLPISKG